MSYLPINKNMLIKEYTKNPFSQHSFMNIIFAKQKNRRFVNNFDHLLYREKKSRQEAINFVSTCEGIFHSLFFPPSLVTSNQAHKLTL